MSNNLKVQINAEIPEEMMEQVDMLISRGRYHTRSEVVRDGLRRIIDEALLVYPELKTPITQNVPPKE